MTYPLLSRIEQPADIRHLSKTELKQLATELRIEARQISALEEDHFEQIGVPVFVKGYIRQCAQRLGLDPHKLMEIYGRPAVDVISELLGGAKDPAEFAFYVMLGVNEGDPWEPYKEDNYCNYLCLRADIKRGHLIMFEPGLVAGSRIQLMGRSHDFSYIERKVDELFDGVGDEQPFFAFYINK